MTLAHRKVVGDVALVGGEVSISGGIIDGQTFRWDTSTLSWVPWDGSLSTGAITIGTVNQGNAGAQMWKVDASGAVVPVSGPLTDVQLRASPVPVSTSNLDVALSTRTKPSDQQHAIIDSGSVNVLNFPSTQPVSAAALPLPSGASTEATLASLLTELGQKTEPANQQHVIVDSSASIPVTGPLTDAQLRASAVPVSGNVGVTGNVEVVNDVGNPLPVSGTFFQATQPVSVAATVNVDVTDDATRDLGKVDVASLDQYTPVSGRLPVDGSGVTQPVSGTVEVVNDVGNPLPVSGTVTANAGTNLNTSALALDTTIAAGGTNKILKRAVVALAATGDIIAAVATKRLKVYQYALQSRNDAMTCQFRDGAAGAMLGLRWGLNAREGASGGAVDAARFLFATSAGNALQAIISGAGTVDIELSFWDDDIA